MFFVSSQDIVTMNVIINPEPTPDICMPRSRTCNDPRHPPCLNDGICMDFPDGTFNCSCQSSFFGAGCQYFDACSTSPCLNGGECMMDQTIPARFTCTCADGFRGGMCEEVISPCEASPCSEGATCMESEDGTSFECVCPAGATGTFCEEDIDDCADMPCENGGTCVDGLNTFSCTCPSGFSGFTCAVPVLFCSPEACENGGTCNEVEGGFECTCPTGFTGDRCSQDVNECDSESACSNGATCVNTPGGFSCFCPQGFTGATCDARIDFCSNDSCNFNGVCRSEVSGFVCSCNPGFTGEVCEMEINECDLASPGCENNAMCVDGIGMFTCICDPGFTGELCESDIDECASSPCANGGSCIDLVANFSCECPAGFTGPTCEEQVDFCVGETCYNGGTCRSLETTFECVCPAGWSGNRCQFPDNVVVKLDSCDFPMAQDMLFDAGLVDSSEPLAVSGGSPSVSFRYNLEGSVGLYFSGWVWQQADTSAFLFSFTDDDDSSIAGQFVSDLTSRELRFQFSTVTDQVINATFVSVPLRPNTWMHVALAVFDDNSVFVNVDGQFSQRQSLQSSTADSDPEASLTTTFEVPAVLVVRIARGVTQLASLDTAGAFSGLVRGFAINAIRVESNSFDLDGLQNCTLACVGGESFCVSGGQCLDLFGPDRRCACPTGYTGLLCQQQHDRIFFDGSGFASTANTQGPLDSLSFSFKTGQTAGEILSHSHSPIQTGVQFQDNRTVSVELSYCDDEEISFSQDISAAQELNNLQYHAFSLSNSLQLDEETVENAPPMAPSSCNSSFLNSILLGGFDTQDQTNSFQGCLRDISLNGAQLDLTSLQLTTGAEFGCRHDTAQFYNFSHLELPQFISRESQRISLEFSTQSSMGILYFSRRVPGDATGNMPNDFVAIHIDEGRAVFTFNLGEQDQNVVLRSGSVVNDGLWHALTAIQNGTMAALYLDGVLVEDQSMGPLVLLDTTGSVFVGGVPSGSRIAGFSGGYTGFDGCVRDLEQNGIAADLLGYISQTNVRFGVCN